MRLNLLVPDITFHRSTSSFRTFVRWPSPILVPTMNTWYQFFVMGMTNTTTAVRVVHTGHCAQRISLSAYTTTVAATTAAALVDCCCSHINSSLQRTPWLQVRLQQLYKFSFVQHARDTMKLFLDETHARGAQFRHVTCTYV